MRISDWSSDVCSSDLGIKQRAVPTIAAMPRDAIEIQALKSDSFGRISLMRDAGGVFVRRDLRHVPWWLWLPAWWLARREARGLRQIGRASCRERVCQSV